MKQANDTCWGQWDTHAWRSDSKATLEWPVAGGRCRLLLGPSSQSTSDTSPSAITNFGPTIRRAGGGEGGGITRVQPRSVSLLLFWA
jgi:hypothetical protein